MIYNVQNRDDLKRAFLYGRRLLEEVGKCIITVTKKKQTRTILQNNYMWGVVYTHLAEASGHTVTEIHEIMKGEILGYIEIDYNDKKHLIPRSTKKLTTSEMENYLERCRAIGAEYHDILIPLPNEVIE